MEVLGGADLVANFPIMISRLPKRGRIRLSRIPQPCRRNRRILAFTPEVKHALTKSILITGPFLGDRLQIERSISEAKEFLNPIIGDRLFDQIMTQPETSPRLFMSVPREALLRMRRIMENEWPYLFLEDADEGGLNGTERTQLIANLIAIENQTGLHRFCFLGVDLESGLLPQDQNAVANTMKSNIMRIGLQGVYLATANDIGFAVQITAPTPNMIAAVYTIIFCCLAPEAIESEYTYQVFSAVFRFLSTLESTGDPVWLSIFDHYVGIINESFAP